MKYKNVEDITYKNFEISTYEINDNDFICDVKTMEGELLKGMFSFTNKIEANNWAIKYIEEWLLPINIKVAKW